MKGRAPLPGSGASAARRSGRKAVWPVLFCGVTVLALLAYQGPSFADALDAPHNLFGGRGVIATPSARMAPDGELYIGASFLKNNQHYNLGFQALPWLEVDFRYSGLQRFEPDYVVYYDRAFGVKARLWDETGLVPAVAVGIDDIVGTGVYNGEYLVASKRFGALDASLGIGWGRHAGTDLVRNPFGLALPSFNERKSFFGQAGGTDFESFFHGRNVGVFGGAVWHTPLDGLSLLVEYDSDNYAHERAVGNFTPRSQVNFGINYDLTDQTRLGLDWLYGASLGGSFAIQLDPVHPQYPQKIEAPPPPLTVRSEDGQRSALAGLLAQRNPGTPEASKLREIRSADRNKFVDALWTVGSDYEDIEIRRNSLDLTVKGDITMTRCAQTRRLLQGISAHVTSISVRNSDGRHSVSCAVPRSMEAAPASAVFLINQKLDLEDQPAIQIATIDASQPSSKSFPMKIESAIRAALKAQNVFVEALRVGEAELVLYYSNYHYQAETDAIDRIVRVLTKEAPPQVERFRLVSVNVGVPTQQFDILRGPAERSYQQEDGDVLDHTVRVSPPALDQPVLAAAVDDNYPRFSWGLFPQIRQALFDPNHPVGIQLLAALGVGVELLPGFTLQGSAEASLYDDFATDRSSDSGLPHVRSDFMKYFTQGKTGIGNLEVDYRFRPSPTVFAKIRTGYLESMFAGAGGEILWRPQSARWALGVDFYQVWQRDFDRLFGLQHYHQSTGHLSLYYDSPWYGLNFQLRAGQYLAGDRGVTFQLTRRFSTGVEIGAFFTKTNVSASQFGEGSFDKGIIIRIPLGWVAPIETQSLLAVDLRPVQRDGGQTLGGDATLYDETRGTSEGELIRQIPGIGAQ